MTITIGAATFPNLVAQPYGYDEVDVRLGHTARKWSIQGLLTPSEWLALLEEYDIWRGIRLTDPDSLVSEDVGTTIQLVGTGPGGQSWDVACWFSSAPSASQSGNKLSASVDLVDAAQALEILIKQQEVEGQEDLPDFGTVTIGSTVVTLRKPVNSYGDGPTLELTAGGGHYLSGPLVVEEILDVEGTTNLTGWNDIRSWYEDQIVAVPVSESWFPISIPTATAEIKIIGGIRTTVYTVSIQLKKVI